MKPGSTLMDDMLNPEEKLAATEADLLKARKENRRLTVRVDALKAQFKLTEWAVCAAPLPFIAQCLPIIAIRWKELPKPFILNADTGR